eukprot:1158325-Pelagomonas_calceolata.AAC.3
MTTTALEGAISYQEQTKLLHGQTWLCMSEPNASEPSHDCACRMDTSLLEGLPGFSTFRSSLYSVQEDAPLSPTLSPRGSDSPSSAIMPSNAAAPTHERETPLVRSPKHRASDPVRREKKERHQSKRQRALRKGSLTGKLTQWLPLKGSRFSGSRRETIGRSAWLLAGNMKDTSERGKWAVKRAHLGAFMLFV